MDSEPVINWNDEELIAAGRVLEKLEDTLIFSEKNPDKMRRIIGLIYDVLRCKFVHIILNYITGTLFRHKTIKYENILFE